MAAKRDADAKKADTPLIQIDGNKKGAASATPALRGRLFAGIASAACIVLIVFSLGFVHPAAGGAWSLAWIVESFQSGGVVQTEASSSGAGKMSSATADSKKDSSGDSSSDAKAKSDSKSEDAKKEGSKDSKESKEGKSSSENSDNKSGQSSSGASSTAGVADSGATGAGSSASGDVGAWGGNSSSGGSSSGGASQDDGLVTVTVSVTSSAVGNPVSAGGTYTFKQGATVYDALCALGLSVSAHGSTYGTYVAAIGGLAEKEHGGSSGWMYSVNGSTPMVACSGYTLSDGDNVVWYYVTG